MKKLLPLLVTLVLAFSLAGAGWAAPPPLLEPMGGKTQVVCPVQGGKINKELYVDYQGQRVYFCCKECIPVFQKNPEAYLRKMREQGVFPEKAPGTK